MDRVLSFAEETSHAYLGWATVLVILTLVERVSAKEETPIASRFAGLLFWIVWIPISGLTNLLLKQLWEAVGIGPLLTVDAVQAMGWAGPFAAVGSIALGVLVADFFGYWHHRIQHAWLWRFHAVHHSVRELNAVNSYHHASEALFSTIIITIPLSLIAVDYGETPVLVSLFVWFQVVFLHSPSRLSFGPFRHIVADNRFHRIHHSLEPAHFDKNFAITFSFWDRMFGTIHDPRPGEWPAVGLAQINQPSTLREWLDLPFRYKEPVPEDRPDQLVSNNPSVTIGKTTTWA